LVLLLLLFVFEVINNSLNSRKNYEKKEEEVMLSLLKVMISLSNDLIENAV
jgi:hypothetical protein